MNWLYPTITQSYHIYDNGSRPFKVVISGNNVEVFKQLSDDDDVIVYESFPIYIFRTREIFVGKSPFNKWTELIPAHAGTSLRFGRTELIPAHAGTSLRFGRTEFSGGHGDKFDGNSLLLHLGYNIYVFVGWEIFSFRALSSIVNFVSIIGNNDVHYPYAIDDKHNIYLLTENVVLRYHDKLFQQMSSYDNPYEYYYHYYLITDELGCSLAKKAIVPNFTGIREFYIGTVRKNYIK